MSVRRFTHVISPRGDLLASIAIGVASYVLYERSQTSLDKPSTRPSKESLFDLVQYHYGEYLPNISFKKPSITQSTEANSSSSSDKELSDFLKEINKEK